MSAFWCGEIIKSIDRNESRHQHLAHCNLWNIYLPNLNTTSSSTTKKEVSCVVKFIERESVYCTIYILQIKLYYLSRLIPIWWWRVLSKSHTRHEFQIITLPKVLAFHPTRPYSFRNSLFTNTAKEIKNRRGCVFRWVSKK